MFDVVGEINWIAVVLATAVSMMLGGVWFAALFGSQYARALGRNPEVEIEMTRLSYLGPLFTSFMSVVASAVLLLALGVETLQDALTFGAIVGIGYLVATMANVAVNPNFPRPLDYVAVNAPYFLLNSLLVSSILVTLN